MMKKVLMSSAVIILSLLANHVYAQESCKVLLQKISGSYAGACKNGLADGKGEASGQTSTAESSGKGFRTDKAFTSGRRERNTRVRGREVLGKATEATHSGLTEKTR